MASSVMLSLGLLLACLAVTRHTRRVKINLAEEWDSSNDKDEEPRELTDKDAASGSFPAAEQSLLQQKVESPGPLRQLALLLLVLEPAAAFHLPGASRSFAAMLEHSLSEGAAGQAVMQDDGSEYSADSAPAAIAMIDDTWQVQDFGAGSLADGQENITGGQLEHDRSIFSLDIEPRERLELLHSTLSDPSVLRDVQEALCIVKEKGFLVGHSEAVEKLFPPGTQSRADLEGLTALRKQVPQTFEELQEQVQEYRATVFEKMQKQMRNGSTMKKTHSAPRLGERTPCDTGFGESVLGWM